MIWKTRITEMIGSKYPIILGAFALIGKAELQKEKDLLKLENIRNE